MRLLFPLLMIVSLCVTPVIANIVSHEEGASVWRSYMNKAYGFTLKYPAYVQTSYQFSRAYLLGTGWSANSNTSKNNAFQHSVWQAQLQNMRGRDKNGESYYYQSYVRIGVSTFPDDITACYKKQANKHLQAALISTLINHKKFYVSAFADAGMSQFNLGTSYRRLQHNTCYSIEYVETGSNSYNIPNYLRITKRNRALAKKIINTFVFVSSHKAN